MDVVAKAALSALDHFATRIVIVVAHDGAESCVDVPVDVTWAERPSVYRTPRADAVELDWRYVVGASKAQVAAWRDAGVIPSDDVLVTAWLDADGLALAAEAYGEAACG